MEETLDKYKKWTVFSITYNTQQNIESQKQ